MSPTIESIHAPLHASTNPGGRDPPLQSLEGTIQRVHYRARELRVIAEGRPWEFILADDCRLWFNGQIAPFRCFQPLDHISIVFEDDGCHLVVHAMSLWAADHVDLQACSKRR